MSSKNIKDGPLRLKPCNQKALGIFYFRCVECPYYQKIYDSHDPLLSECTLNKVVMWKLRHFKNNQDRLKCI